MWHEVSRFEMEQLRIYLAAKDAEMRELRGTLGSTALRLESETTELWGRLERERLRRQEVEQLFGNLHTNHYGSVGVFRDVYRQINEDMDVFGLQSFVPYSAFDEGKLNHLTFFF